MPKNKSLIYQVREVLNQKLRIGESRHHDKQIGITHDGIYSWGTYNTYLSKSCAFVKWVRSNYDCKTLEEARQYVDAYLKHHIDQGYSPYTQKTIASALAKLYGCSTKDFIPTQTRRRADITRSRRNKAKFCEAKNKDFVDFCKATGLRRHELKNLTVDNIEFDKATGRWMLINIKGKGGKLRNCPILSEKAIDRIVVTPIGYKVWDKIPSRADIHSYRADYCKALYKIHARPIADIPKVDRYYCRNDLKGVIYDKRAMAIASRALGHNRIGIIASNYLHGGGAGE